MDIARGFIVRTLMWGGLLAVVHSGLRVVGGVAEPQPFLADITHFSAAMLGLAALVAGIQMSRSVLEGSWTDWTRLIAVGLSGLVLGAGAYFVVDHVAPPLRAEVAVGSAETPVLEPAALTSAQIRTALAAHVESAPPAVEARRAGDHWPTFNRLAFEHERRIVQSLLIAVFGLVGVLAGAQARKMPRPFGGASLWGLAAFLLPASFMAGENGHEWIVMQSAGPMEFAAWLQTVVPGSVLIGLLFAALPSLLRPSDAE